MKMLFNPKRVLLLTLTMLLVTLSAMQPPLQAQEIDYMAYFPETGYGIDNNAIWDYFRERGGISTFGYPVSNTFLFLGFEVQIFQRHVIQAIGEQARPINLLDPEFMPVTMLNRSTFPAYDRNLAAAAPSPEMENYAQEVLLHLVANVPNEVGEEGVNFLDYYYSSAPESAPGLRTLIALEVWGFPTSAPMRDPNNSDFIYQRFQRGIMHYDAASGFTGGILLGDAFKSLLTGLNLPDDLAVDLADSPFLRLYNPDELNAMARTSLDIEPPLTRVNTDLSNAFNPGDVAEPPPVPEPPTFSSVNLFFIALDDAGASGPIIGCGDSVISVAHPIEPTAAPLTAAFEELLSIKSSTYQQTNLYHALYRTDLQVQQIFIEDGRVTVRLIGEYQINGTCDEPRVKAQLTQTALQFATIDSVELYINGRLIE